MHVRTIMPLDDFKLCVHCVVLLLSNKFMTILFNIIHVYRYHRAENGQEQERTGW